MTPTVALSTDFLKALNALPKSQTTKVHAFIEKFRENPESPGINYEKINAAKDPNVRSARVDQSYRVILLKPEKGNVYMLLWVDHHDEAYRWAENKTWSIHPETGSIQVIPTETIVADPATFGRDETGGLVGHVRDRELIRLGVPEEQIGFVRTLETEADLERAAALLPQEAYEALYLLAAGYSVADTARELLAGETPAVDTTDFRSALDNPDTQRRFVVIDDDAELASILEAPLEQWRVFLHPTQRRIVEARANGPMRVLGGAGTGKTVVAMHRARRLAESLTGAERLLFTTFTKNLAADIREHLTNLCAPDVMRRIDVVNIDQWVHDFLESLGYEFDIVYGNRTDGYWEDALNHMPAELKLPPGFYRQEWERVIQPSGVTTREEYFKASRVGRGISLNRRERAAVWPVFEQYREALSRVGWKEPEDAMRDAREILESGSAVLPYRCIVVDEAQDMNAQAFRLIRAMITGGDRENDIFIVGDAHQRIYRHRVALGQCGINIRGRSRRLRVNYRTTEETRRWACALLDGVAVDDLDEGTDTQRGYRSLMHGAEPVVRHFASFQGEVAAIVEHLKRLESDGIALASTCVAVRTKQQMERYEGALSAAGIEVCRIQRSQAEDRSKTGVRLATMHRVKGLEFDEMIIAGVNDDVMPYTPSPEDVENEHTLREIEDRERSLLHVAATRARRSVMVTSCGKASRFLRAEADA